MIMSLVCIGLPLRMTDDEHG